jgi:alpha-beta hydrolase superfamily lysophospholipase
MIKDRDAGIIYRKWHSPFSRAVILLVHGLGGHSGRWGFLADFLLENNISSYSIELAGFGQTETLKGHIESFRDYFRDIRNLRDIIAKEHSGENIFILGESLGGLLAFLLVAAQPGLFKGLVCVSPAFKSTLRFSIVTQMEFIFSLLGNPRRQFTVPFSNYMCTRDTKYQSRMDSDEREHRFATAKLLFNTLIGQIRAARIKKRLFLPILFLISGKDEIVDEAVSSKIFRSLRTKDKKLIRYPDMYHALTIDIGREKVFHDIRDWIEERIGKQGGV